MTRRCELPDCDRPHAARGFCNLHWQRWKRHGDAEWLPQWRGRSTEDRFWVRVRKAGDDECWIWTGAVSGDAPFQYGTLLHESVPLRAHRFSYLLHKGEIPEKMDVCHTCDNPVCVNPSHLFVGTRSDNVQDMVQKGRCNNAGKGKAKLTAKQVQYIRNQATGRYGEVASFAREFGVGHSTMRYVLNGTTWRHLL